MFEFHINAQLISIYILSVIPILSMPIQKTRAQAGRSTVLNIKKTKNFNFNGDSTADNWSKTNWVHLSQIKGVESGAYDTKVKVLYSDTGIYFLFDCQDKKLNADMHDDFKKLWKQDVVEVFLWPDETIPDYFEYELSPLNYELPLLISNRQADRGKWIPFQYYGSRRQSRHKVSIKGGKNKSGASIKKWIAEIFIPYKLLKPLNNTTPKRGAKWRANLYRIDYDKKNTKWWAWQPIKKSFHEYKKYGVLLFE